MPLDLVVWPDASEGASGHLSMLSAMNGSGDSTDVYKSSDTFIGLGFLIL